MRGRAAGYLTYTLRAVRKGKELVIGACKAAFEKQIERLKLFCMSQVGMSLAK